MEEMSAKPGEIFLLKYCWNDTWMGEDEYTVAPCFTMEQVVKTIREHIAKVEIDEDTICWFEIEKWVPNEKGTMLNLYAYFAPRDKIFFYRYCNWCNMEFEDDFLYSTNLNLPIPFRPRDVLEIDCRPFQLPVRAVLLGIGNYQDRCMKDRYMVPVLHLKSDKRWYVGAVNHGNVFPSHFGCDLFPLYRVTKFQRQLPENERLLETVS